MVYQGLLQKSVLYRCDDHDDDDDEREPPSPPPTRNDFKCLANSLGFSMFIACPAFFITSNLACSPMCLHIYYLSIEQHTRNLMKFSTFFSLPLQPVPQLQWEDFVLLSPYYQCRLSLLYIKKKRLINLLNESVIYFRTTVNKITI